MTVVFCTITYPSNMNYGLNYPVSTLNVGLIDPDHWIRLLYCLPGSADWVNLLSCLDQWIILPLVCLDQWIMLLCCLPWSVKSLCLLWCAEYTNLSSVNTFITYSLEWLAINNHLLTFSIHFQVFTQSSANEV